MRALLESPAVAAHHHRNGTHPRLEAVDDAAPAADAPSGQELSIDELIFDYLTLSMPLPSLARRHGLTVRGLADALESEPAQTLIRRMTRLASQRARALAIQNRASAIASLETTMATTDDPETARKAATTLIRTSDRVLHPPRRGRVTTKRTPEQPDATPTGDPAAPDTRATPDEAASNSPNASPDSSSAPPGGRLCGESPTPPSAPRPRRSSSGAG